MVPHRPPFPRLARFPALACALALSAICAPRSVRADEVDRQDGTPTAWWNYYGQSPAQVAKALGDNGARLIDIQVTDNSPLTFAVTMVKNAGAYAKAWEWYYGVDVAFLSQKCQADTMRMVVVRPYDDGGAIKYAAILEKNTGANARTWWWWVGATADSLSARATAYKARLIDLTEYQVGGQTRYAAIMIANTGASEVSWWWWLGQTGDQLAAKLGDEGGRILSLQRTADGKFNAVIAKSGASGWWWYYGLTAAQLGDKVDQLGARIYSYQPYAVGDRTYFAALLVNNSDSLTTALGDIVRAGSGAGGVYLKRVAGPELVALRPDYRFEPASGIKVLIHYHALSRVKAGKASLDDSVDVDTTYNTAVSYSCPANHYPGDKRETLRTALSKMMMASDNTRTAALRHHFGQNPIDSTRIRLGMASTDLEPLHVIGCGDVAILHHNRLTLRDAGKLYEAVGRDSLGAETRDFHDLMLHDTLALAALVDEEAPKLGKAAIAAAFKAKLKHMDKGGSYGLPYPGGLIYYRDENGWFSLPIANGADSRDYVYGAFVDSATNDSLAAAAVGKAASEVARAEIDQALATWSLPTAVAARHPDPPGLVALPGRGFVAFRLEPPASGPVEAEVVDLRGGRLGAPRAVAPAAGRIGWKSPGPGVYVLGVRTAAGARSRAFVSPE